ncbi:MAG: sigma-54-dependent Fis family transcriptional regulator [Deltaproteobacteria bacterium]|nr:sigma-54-dependent Fis family transcriptional regulator [Deltaproteobacteria bacterium]
MKKLDCKILIVDDNEELLEAFEMFLSPHFKIIETLRKPDMAPARHRSKNFDIILLDMNFKAGINTGNEGIYWMNKILEQDPQATIVFITAYGDIELAVKTIKEGAADFIQKSWDENKILATLINAYKQRQSKLEIKKLKQKQKHLNEKVNKPANLVLGKSPAMEKIFVVIDRVAETDANILLLGENGTGKEVIAREIHRRSVRSGDIFVNVDLGSLNENLFESELFGFKKGSFTGANEDRSGRFEIASGGTLFLDEIANIPLHLQAKLLSVVQNQEVIPVGSSQSTSFNTRLICATNADLNKMVEDNLFREDLLYRINTIQLVIPPLRERPEDIPELANYFLSKFSDKYNKAIQSIDKKALKLLTGNIWKGNVRELEHVVEKAVILCDGDVLTTRDFYYTHSNTQAFLSADNFNLTDHERNVIIKALDRYSGNLTKTAQKLGINRSTLYEKIKKYGL